MNPETLRLLALWLLAFVGVSTLYMWKRQSRIPLDNETIGYFLGCEIVLGILAIAALVV